MDENSLFAPLFAYLLATDRPSLPSLALTRHSVHLLWALVLAAGTVWLLQRPGPRWQWHLAAMVFLATLAPGHFSPAYWLGLTFQSPSLSTALLCLFWLHGKKTAGTVATVTSSPAPMANGGHALVALALVLGWVLGLDVWGQWPISLYSWGFSPLALLLVAALALLLNVARPSTLAPVAAHARAQNLLSRMGLAPELALVWLVLLVFVLTRLPSGNLWDALLDPWLWVVLQVRWLRYVLRWLWSAAGHTR